MKNYTWFTSAGVLLPSGVLLTACTLLVLPACKKSSPGDPYAKETPVIQSCVVTNACNGIVTITGATFDTVVARDSVFFDNVKGTILSASATQIIAEMPQTTLAGLVTVYCEMKRTISTDSVYRYVPVIDSFAPAVAGPGTQISIWGHGFNPNPQSDSVYFNNIAATVDSVAPNRLVVNVPAGNTTGPITLRSNCENAAATGTFTLLNKGVVYIGTNGGYFYSIDITSGRPRWMVYMASGTGSPVVSNGVVYISGETVANTTQNAYALDANTGKEWWNFDTVAWNGYPTLNQDTVWGGKYDGSFYAINAQNGQPIWSFRGPNESNFWSMSCWYNGLIYVSDGVGDLDCLNSSTGSLVWSLPLWTGPPVVSNGILYVASATTGGTYALNALDPGTGAVIWTNNTYEIGSTAAIANGVVYAGTGLGNLLALNASTGQQIWQSNAGLPTRFAQVVGNTLYFTTGGGALQSVDIASGSVNWSVVLASSPFDQPGAVVADGVIYAGDGNGVVHAINAATGSTVWTLKTVGAPIESSPCVVDSGGAVHYGGQ